MPSTLERMDIDTALHLKIMETYRVYGPPEAREKAKAHREALKWVREELDRIEEKHKLQPPPPVDMEVE